MNKRIKQLAIQAGFVPWGDEPWAPGDEIDWSNRYDQQLEQFAQLILEQVEDIILDADESPKLVVREPYRTIINRIDEHFGDE